MILILYPSSFLKSLFKEAITARDYEDLGVLVNLMLLFPNFDIGNVGKYLNLGHISFHK
jgi:hypothetical protein